MFREIIVPWFVLKWVLKFFSNSFGIYEIRDERWHDQYVLLLKSGQQWIKRMIFFHCKTMKYYPVVLSFTLFVIYEFLNEDGKMINS